jgi:hypothetical protein
MTQHKSEIIKEKVTITKGDPAQDFWLSGHVTKAPAYTFHAKVYDAGSEFGIDNGRISKLTVFHNGNAVMHYDRGWDQKPGSWKDKKALRDIVAGFPDPANLKNGIAATKRGLCFGRR